MNRRLLLGAIFFLALFSISPCDELTVIGSSTLQPIIKEVGKTFNKKTGIIVKVKGGGSSKGIKSAADGSADIGMASRDIKATETQDLHVHSIGIDGVAILVNKANSLSNITSEQVVLIYRGKLTNWKDLGGSDLPIKVGKISKGHGTRELFDNFFKLRDNENPNAHITHTVTEALLYVSSNACVIIFASVGRAKNAISKGAGIKILKLNGIEASTTTIEKKIYPLLRPLYLVTKKEPEGIVAKFIDFVTGTEGQKIIKTRDLIPLFR